MKNTLLKKMCVAGCLLAVGAMAGCGNNSGGKQEAEANIPDSIASQAVVMDAGQQQTPQSTDMTAETPSAQQAPEAQTAAAPEQLVYSVSDDGFLNIRREPSAKAEIVGRLKTNGEGAKYLGEKGGWYKVEYYGAVGYVNSKFARYDGVRQTASPSQKVYYLVVGSFETLESAKKGLGTLPDWMVGPVYRVSENGKVVYRICYACYSTKTKAANAKRELDQVLSGARAAWIWESNGLADCVYRPGSLRDENEKVPVLTPQ